MMSGKPIDLEYFLTQADTASQSTLRRMVKSLANTVKLREQELEAARAINRAEKYKSELGVEKKPARRHGNTNYLEFLDYLFEKNRTSVFPCPRPLFYNLAQQIFREIQLSCESQGAQNFIKNMELNKEYRTK